jgi:hypothetical protein
MDSSVISGLMGGLVATIIGVAAAKAARRKATNGELKHGLFILILAILCLIFSSFAVWAFFNDNDVHEKTSELISVIGLFLGFGLCALACFAEYFKVHGVFCSEKIEFHTPWTGTKCESWDNLVSAQFNASMHWYELKFKSGKTIRLSSYLHGYGGVLEILRNRGFEF